MEKKPKLEFQKGHTYRVTLLFDEPKTGKNQKGNDWYLFGVLYDGTEYNFFADYDLTNELKKYARNTKLEIVDRDDSDNPYKHSWSVVSVGGNQPLSEIMKPNETTIKIEVWAAMKVASNISKDIDELNLNTQSVLQLHKQICEQQKDEEELF